MVVLDGLALEHIKAWISPLNFSISSAFSQIRQPVGSMCELAKIIRIVDGGKKQSVFHLDPFE